MTAAPPPAPAAPGGGRPKIKRPGEGHHGHEAHEKGHEADSHPPKTPGAADRLGSAASGILRDLVGTTRGRIILAGVAAAALAGWGIYEGVDAIGEHRERAAAEELDRERPMDSITFSLTAQVVNGQMVVSGPKKVKIDACGKSHKAEIQLFPPMESGYGIMRARAILVVHAHGQTHTYTIEDEIWANETSASSQVEGVLSQ